MTVERAAIFFKCHFNVRTIPVENMDQNLPRVRLRDFRNTSIIMGWNHETFDEASSLTSISYSAQWSSSIGWGWQNCSRQYKLMKLSYFLSHAIGKIAQYVAYALGWHCFAKKFSKSRGQAFFTCLLSPKHFKKSKFSHIDGRLPMPTTDSNLWSGPQ